MTALREFEVEVTDKGTYVGVVTAETEVHAKLVAEQVLAERGEPGTVRVLGVMD